MKKIFPVAVLLQIACCLLPTVSFAQLQGSFTIGGAGGEGGTSIVQTTDGSYAVAGTTNSGAGGGISDFYVVKLTPAWVLQWTKTVGGPGLDWGQPTIIQTTDGGYAVTGRTDSYGAGNDDFYIVKLDIAGTLQWTKTVGGANGEQAWDIIQTTDGGYAVTGATSSYGAGGSDVYVVKLDNAGALQWTRTIGGAGADWGNSIVQTIDGGYAVAGYTDSYGAGGKDFYVVKMDNMGTLQWTKTIGGTGNEYGNSIVQTTDGGYAVAGRTHSYGAGSADVYVMKLDNAGTLQWTRTIGGTGVDYGYEIIQATDGGYVVAGHTDSYGAGGSDVYVLKLDNAGTLQWTKTIGGTGSDASYSIVQTIDGGYAIAGATSSYGAGGSDVYVLKLDANGGICVSSGSGGIIGSGGSEGSGGITNNGGTTNSGGILGGGGILNTLCITTSFLVNVVPVNVSCNGNCTGSATATPTGGGNPYTYLWNPGGQSTSTATGLCDGAYSVLVTDAGGNAATAIVTITQPTMLTATVTSTPSACGSNNGTANATAGGGSPSYTYSWNPGGQTTFAITGIAAGTYTATITDANGCYTTQIVTVVSSGSVTTTNQSASICTGSTYTLPGGTVVSTGGIYIDTLTSTGGCDSIITTTLTVNPNPKANIYSNVTITHGQSVTLTASGGGTYLWSPATGLNCTTCATVTASPLLGAGGLVYCVTVTDLSVQAGANNCTDTACVTITIELIDCSNAGELYLPNTFSPNNDGENDLLQIYYGNLKCIKTFNLVIYNRWGEKVFNTNNPVAQWDGSYKGKIGGTAVFVYYLKTTLISGEEIIRKGNISLIK